MAEVLAGKALQADRALLGTPIGRILIFRGVCRPSAAVQRTAGAR
jgi:hypothetical protein